MPKRVAAADHRMLDILRDCRLLLAVTLHGPDDWRGLGELLQEAAIPGVEVMLRSPHAWDGLRQLRKTWPKLILGVGTANSVQDLQKSRDEGTDFVVSPGTRDELLDFACLHKLVYMPGAMQPSDLMAIASAGFCAAKFFPAAPLGPAYLQALAGPFADLRFCVSGGLEIGNYRQFLRVRQVAALSGSWPLPRHLSDPEACRQALPLLKALAEELKLALATENPPPAEGART